MARLDLRVAASVALMGVVLLGCDKASSGTLTLDGRRFVSESVEGYTLFPGTVVGLSFGEGEMGMSAGCNSMVGPYEISGGRLHFPIEWVDMTAIGCSEELSQQETWVYELLSSEPTLTLDEPRLSLGDGSSAITFLDREVAAPDLPLVGTEWTLSGFIEAGGFGFGPWPTTVLRFADDGTFGIAEGCPTAQGQYAADGAVLTFSGGTTSLDACPAEPQYAFDVATTVLSDGETNFAIDSSGLMLMRGDQGLAFVGR